MKILQTRFIRRRRRMVAVALLCGLMVSQPLGAQAPVEPARLAQPSSSPGLFLPWLGRQADIYTPAEIGTDLRTGRPIPLDYVEGFANANELAAIAYDGDRILWGGSQGGGLLRWDLGTGTHVRLTAPLDLPDDRVLDLAWDPDGSLWVATQAGVVRLPAGGSRFEPLAGPEGRTLDRPVVDLDAETDGSLHLAVDGLGLLKRDPDGAWQGLHGAHALVEGLTPDRLALEAIGSEPDLAPGETLQGPLLWFGQACADLRPGPIGQGAIALIDAGSRRDDCAWERIAAAVEQVGAVAALVFGSSELDGNADGTSSGFPLFQIDDRAGLALRDQLLAGQPGEAILQHDGAPNGIQHPTAVALDADGSLWIGSDGFGLLRRRPDGSWTSFTAEPPAQVRGVVGLEAIATRELPATQRLAILGRLRAGLADAGDACGPIADGSLTDRLALVAMQEGGCGLHDRLRRVEAAGAVGALVHDGEAAFSEARFHPYPWEPLGIPGLWLPGSDAAALIERLGAGQPIELELPARLPSDHVTSIAIDDQGRHWAGTRSGPRDRLGYMNGGATRIDAAGADAHAVTGWRTVDWRIDSGVPPFWDPAEQILDIAPGPDGRVWMGTLGGLIEIGTDGRRRRHTRLSTSGALPHDRVAGITSGPDGELWLATAAGAARATSPGEPWTHLRADDTIPSNQLAATAIDAYGDVWAGGGARPESLAPSESSAGTGLGRRAYDTGDWRQATDPMVIGSSFLALLGDPESSSMWLGGQDGLKRVDVDTSAVTIPPDQPSIWVELGEDQQYFVAAVETMFAPSAGRIEAPLTRYGAGCPESSEPPPTGDLEGRVALIERSLASAACVYGDQLADAGRRGAVAAIVFVTHPSQENVTGYESDPDAVPSMYVHADDARRIEDYLRSGRPARVSMRSGRWFTAGIDTYDLALDPDGSLWAAGVASLDRLSPSGVWSNEHMLNSGLRALEHPRPVLRSVSVDAEGTLWAGTQHAGAIRRAADGESWEVFDAESTAGALPDRPISDIEIDASGGVWFATQGGGAVRRDPSGRTWTSHTRDAPRGAIPSDDVRDIELDRDGGTWLATAGGLALLSADGALRDRLLHAAPINSLSLHPDGDVWFGSEGLGLSHLSRRDPGEDCDAAARLAPGAVVDTALSSQADIDLYAIEIDEPFSRIELTLADPNQQLDLFLRHSCVGIGGTGRHIGGTGRHIGGTGRHIGGTGRHIGGTGRHIGVDQRLVFDALAETGTYYVDVRPRIGSRQGPIDYRLRSGLARVDLASRRTLVLTDVDAMRNAWGLDASSPEYLEWLDGLQGLQADPTVGALLITDLKTQTDGTVRQAFADWLSVSDPSAVNDKANALAGALRDWIWDLRDSELPRLQYLIIAADDRIIPHQRLVVEPPSGSSGWRPESSYLDGRIDPDSTVARALADDRILSDDIYAAPAPVDGVGVDGLHLPELSVGRLVERPSQMTAVLRSFAETGGRLRLGSSLVAAGEAFAAAGEEAGRALRDTGLPEADRSQLRGDRWQADALAARLLKARHEIVLAALPGDHRAWFAPDGFALRAGDLRGADNDLTGMLVFSLASHAGLNLPGPAHTFGDDWPERWLEQGASYIASSAFSYGLEGELQYAEKLMSHALRIAVQGDGRVIGDALVAAKQDYYRDLLTASPHHAATLAGTLLYGMPMARISIATQPLEPEDAPSTAWGAEASDTAEAVSGRHASPPREVAPGLWSRVVRQEFPTSEIRSGPDGSPYEAMPGQQAWLEAGAAAQAQLRVELPELAMESASLPARGLLWLGGEAEDLEMESMWVPRARVSAPAGNATEAGASNELRPPLPVGLRTWKPGELLVSGRHGRAHYALGQGDLREGLQRRWTRIDTEEYFGNSADRAAPLLLRPAVLPSGASARLVVDVIDEAPLHRVVAVYDDGSGTWRALDLEPATAPRWTAELPAFPSEPLVVQAVDAGGQVGVAFAK